MWCVKVWCALARPCTALSTTHLARYGIVCDLIPHTSHTSAGFLTTNMSLGAVNVSLTHTIKSLE